PAYDTDIDERTTWKSLRVWNGYSGEGTIHHCRSDRIATASEAASAAAGSIRRSTQAAHATAKPAPSSAVSLVNAIAAIIASSQAPRPRTAAVAARKSSSRPTASTRTTSHASRPTTGGAIAITAAHAIADARDAPSDASHARHAPGSSANIE